MPSAIVLLKPNHRDGRDAMRAALGTLGMQQLIRRAPPSNARWFRETRFEIVAPSGERRVALSPAGSAVYEALSRKSSSSGFTAAEILMVMQKEFGIGYQKFMDELLVPQLVDKGLLERKTARRLWFFSYNRLELTTAGHALQVQLQALKLEVDRIPHLIRSDPQSAVLACVRLGPALLLGSHLGPHLKKLSAIARDQASGVEMARLLDEPDARSMNWLDGQDMLLSMDWTGILDSLEGAFDASDAGADGGSSDGGGDGSD